MSNLKTCSKCGETKPREEFTRNKSKRDGLSSPCKACRKAYKVANREKINEGKRKYYADNREKAREYQETNREKIAERKRKYYAANREKINEGKRKYYADNRGKITKQKREYDAAHREQRRNYKEANREKVAEQERAYRQAHPEKARAKGSRRRAAKRNALHPEHDLKREQWLHKLARRLERITGEPWHVDHIVPLAQGGWHHHDNLQIIPAKWNCQKQANAFWEPASPCPPWFRVPDIDDFASGKPRAKHLPN